MSLFTPHSLRLRNDAKSENFYSLFTVYHSLTLSHSTAFTLAEVLITLGIIGMVAAMTIPTLMQNTQDAQYKSGYKKGIPLYLRLTLRYYQKTVAA